MLWSFCRSQPRMIYCLQREYWVWALESLLSRTENLGLILYFIVVQFCGQLLLSNYHFSEFLMKRQFTIKCFEAVIGVREIQRVTLPLTQTKTSLRNSFLQLQLWPTTMTWDNGMNLLVISYNHGYWKLSKMSWILLNLTISRIIASEWHGQ